MEDLTVDQRTLARIFGVSVRTVQRYEDVGLDEARVEGTATYDLPRAVAWLVERAEDNGGRGESKDEYEKWRTAKVKADAQAKEIDLAERRGELVPIDDVADRVRKPLEEVDAQLRSAPRRLAKGWAARIGKTHAEAIALIGELTEDIRADLRRLFEDDE